MKRLILCMPSMCRQKTIQITRNYHYRHGIKMTPPLSIRPMEQQKAEELARLFVQVVEPLPYYNETAKRSEIAKYPPRLLREVSEGDPDSILVASLEDQLVGFCFSRYDDDLVWLNWFGVHPSHRGKGIAKALLQALEISRKGKTHKIWCDCRTENEASKNILTSQGYHQICTVRNHWYKQDYILWEKFIA
jgi:RimJ/RimL family protein N-acetyltransferase